jgi:hypothetical protein
MLLVVINAWSNVGGWVTVSTLQTVRDWVSWDLFVRLSRQSVGHRDIWVGGVFRRKDVREKRCHGVSFVYRLEEDARCKGSDCGVTDQVTVGRERFADKAVH